MMETAGLYHDKGVRLHENVITEICIPFAIVPSF